jgi:UDP-sugar pyrophosphorylase
MQALLRMLMENGQGHVIAFWAVLGQRDAQKRALVSQLLSLDSSYPGGLRTYIGNAATLLKSSQRGDNPYDGYTPEVPTGVTLSLGPDGREEFERYERLGVAEAARTAFVLVAGGLGERLGYSGVKVRSVLSVVSAIAIKTARNCEDT